MTSPKKPRLHLARLIARFARCLPAALDRAHLQWALSELTRHNPMHPDVPCIVRRIRELGGA